MLSLKKNTTVLFLIFFYFFLFLPKDINADSACGVGSTCAGSTSFIVVTTCTVLNTQKFVPANTTPKPKCVNELLDPNYLHICPTGGAAGTCTALAPGKNGCSNLDAIYVGATGICTTTGFLCANINGACGTGPIYGFCEGDLAQWSCNNVQSASGPLGCCYTPANYCGDGICNGVENCATCSDCCGPTPPPVICGDGSCNAGAGENCSSCTQDCGSCPPICGNSSCEVGETPGSCPADCSGEICGAGGCNTGAGENCSNCPGDCGACTGCGDGVCSAGETPATCPSDCVGCGDGICSASESCSICSADCGACVGDFCGNGTCSAFETCTSCAGDCGTCPANLSWWQARGGSVYAARASSPAIASIVPGLTCTEPTCAPYLLAQLQASLLPNSDGVLVTGGGNIQSDGYYTPRNLVALGSQLTRYKEGYDFFYRKSGLSIVPNDAFTASHSSATLPATSGIYFSNQNLTIQEPWSISDTQSYAIFVNGDLTIQDTTNAGTLISVAPGGFLAFIVNGDIIIESSVGHTNSALETPNIEGVYIAENDFRITSDLNPATSDRRFIGAGSFIGWNGVSLQREFDDGGSGSTLSETIPTELFIYRPDFVFTAPSFMLSPHSIWQETN